MKEIDEAMQNGKLTNLELAPILRRVALEKADDLFEQGDLTPFLSILSRFHTFNFYNLLLILHQYPTATYLGAFADWQQLLRQLEPEKRMVIKENQIGMGINLIAPFTSRYPKGTQSLLWHRILQFDISQTNLTRYVPPQSIYSSGPEHIRILTHALCGILSDEHGKSVQVDLDRDRYRSGNPGFTDGNWIFYNPSLSPEAILMWLTECFLAITYPHQVLGTEHQRTFLCLAQHCLLRIWGIDNPRMLFLPRDPTLIQSIQNDLRPVFLDLLQRRVRRCEEDVHRKYQEYLREKRAVDITNILATFARQDREGEVSHEDSPSGLE